MQNPPPPPPPGSMPPPPGSMPPPPPGFQPLPAGGAAPMAVPGNLASPGLRVVGGLVDLIILGVISAIVGALFKNNQGVSSFFGLILTLAYFGYLLNSRGQSVGMMIFGFRVRDIQTGQYPTLGKAVLRGFIWYLEVGFTVCIIGLIGWLWMFWDPQKQGWHDKAAGTIVTTS